MKRKKSASSMFKIDLNTGRKVRKNATRSRIAKKAARKRKGKHQKQATKLKISRSNKKVARTGRLTRGKHRKSKR